MDVSRAAAEDNALFYRCAGCIQSILHAVLLFLHLGLSCRTDTDDRDAAGQLCQTLLQLLLVEVRLGIRNFLLDLGNAVCNILLVAFAVDNDSLLLADLYALRMAELLKSRILQLKTNLGADHLAASQNGDILQHCLASVAIARSLDSNDVEGAAQIVHDQGGQSLAVNILSDDQERLAGLDELVQQRKQILNVGNLLIRDQDVRILEVRFHLLGIICHVSADIATVELHTFDQLQLILHGLGFLDGDDTVLGNLLHRVSDHLADFLAAGGNRSDLLDMILAVDRSCHRLDCLDSRISSLLHALAKDNRICACSQVLHALVDHCLSKDRSSCRAIAGDIVRLLSDLLHKLGAHVFEAVLQLDFLRDGHAIVCDDRCAVALVKNDISALRTKRNFDGICQLVHAICKSNSCICAML